MREIKFRAWDKVDDKMYCPIVGIDWETDTVILTAKMAYAFDTVELMQFTGLKDKTGKEIYEGDILIPITMYNKQADSIREVKWDINCFTLPRCSWLYVIGGNIYENPELLKE